jgi:hypothetical protein
MSRSKKHASKNRNRVAWIKNWPIGRRNRLARTPEHAKRKMTGHLKEVQVWKIRIGH